MKDQGLGMVVHICNPSPGGGSEARASRVPGQPGLHSDILSKKKKKIVITQCSI
jgi:hypothetical protein